jgi:hypothetical protein
VLWSEEAVSLALEDLLTLLNSAPPPDALIEALGGRGDRLVVGPLLGLWSFAGRTGATGAEQAEEALVEILERSPKAAHVLVMDAFLYLLGVGGCARAEWGPGGTGGVAALRPSPEDEARPMSALEVRETTRRWRRLKPDICLIGRVQELTSHGLSPLERRLRAAEQEAEATVLLLKALGADSRTPGLLLERLLLIYVRLKVRWRRRLLCVGCLA